jgi:hypothetical protein
LERVAIIVDYTIARNASLAQALPVLAIFKLI